jgi:hypothetical protein
VRNELEGTRNARRDALAEGFPEFHFAASCIRPAHTRGQFSPNVSDGDGAHISLYWCFGEVAEWLMAPVLKTGEPKGFVSSNLTLSAICVMLART